MMGGLVLILHHCFFNAGILNQKQGKIIQYLTVVEGTTVKRRIV